MEHGWDTESWDQKLISCVQWPLQPLQPLAAPRLMCFLKNPLSGEWEPGPAQAARDIGDLTPDQLKESAEDSTNIRAVVVV